jgi:photosystem II stability/assembly factor-like uncharacterized protein
MFNTLRQTIVTLSVFFLTSICGFAQRVPTAQAYTFNPVQIVAGGYVPGLVAHPTQPGLIYARTDIGSVYRWNAAFNVWVPLTDFNSPDKYNLNGPESIALDPTDPNRLYIAAGMYTYSGAPYAILVSTNQGASFTTYPVPFSMGSNNDGRAAGERLAVNPFKPSELMMGTRAQGLWVSEDHAQTWTQVASFPVQSSSDGFGVQWVLFDPQHSGVVYVGSYTTATIYRSQNGGATWSALANEPSTWPVAVPPGTLPPAPERAVINPDGNLYVNLTDLPGPNNMNYGMVQKYNPLTDAWTNITPGGLTGSRGGFAGLTQDLTRPGTVAVSTFDRWYPVDTVYITHDGGSTWVDLGAVTSNNGVDGPPYGNYYFNPSVFMPTSPWLTFGNTSYPTSPTPTAKFGWWISALLIDPTNPNHLMFGTGATIYATNNVSAADSGNSPAWYVQGLGIEETAVIVLISPTQGPHLLSGVGDIGGFRHDDFTTSPLAGMYTNPVATTTGSLDWAGQNPLVVVRSQSPSSAGTSPCTYGAYATDGGTNWSPFASCATGANSGNGGTIAIDAAGTMLMWSPASGSSNRPQYSNNLGTSWTVTNGLPARIVATADKVVPATFYAFYNNGASSAFYSTTNSGGTTFTKVNTTALPSGSSSSVVVNWAKPGDIWLALGSSGLFHSTDGGVTWIQLPNVAAAYSVAVGAAKPGSTTQSIFLYGISSPLGISAIYRSDDNGVSWLRINDDIHQYGGPTLIQADPRIYGRVYLGMNGRGIIYGDIAQ